MSGSSSSTSSREGSRTPVQSVLADEHDVDVLRHRRRELGKVWTSVQRLEGLIADSNEVTGLDGNLSVAVTNLNRMKARLAVDPLVQLYDRVNPGRTLMQRAYHDAFMIDQTIQFTPLAGRPHWTNFVNQYMDRELPDWGSKEHPIYIAQEDPNARHVRRSTQRRSESLRRGALRQSESAVELLVDPNIVTAERRRAQMMEQDRHEHQERQRELERQYNKVMSVFDARAAHDMSQGRMPLPAPPTLAPLNTTNWRGLSGANLMWPDDNMPPAPQSLRVETLKGAGEVGRGRKTQRDSSPRGRRSGSNGSQRRQPMSDPQNLDVD